jgi:hypothetical protein
VVVTGAVEGKIDRKTLPRLSTSDAPKRISWAVVHNSGLHVSGHTFILPAK